MTDLPKSPKRYPYITTKESDVDSLVVEEVFSSNEFQSWLLEKLSEDYKNAKFIGAWKNVDPIRHGECDIVIEFLINNKKKARINCINHLLSLVDYEDVEHPVIELPDRSWNLAQSVC